jgi:DNA-binding XRE family transcriptional regulator
MAQYAPSLLLMLAQLGSVVPVQTTDVPHANVAVDGAAIRKRRQEMGETVTSFAERVGCSFGYLSQIERGTRPRVSPAFFLKLTETLGYAANPDQIRAGE